MEPFQVTADEVLNEMGDELKSAHITIAALRVQLKKLTEELEKVKAAENI